MGVKDFFKPKWQSDDPRKREKAVKELSDKALLLEIANNDKEGIVRMAAIKKLDDQELLASIATSGKDAYDRLYAAGMLADTNIAQQVYIDIARNAEDFKDRRAAVKKIYNQNVIADILYNDGDYAVREAALEVLDDQEILADITRNTDDDDYRYIALNKLTDQDLLLDIAKNDKDSDFRKHAATMLEARNLTLQFLDDTDVYDGKLYYNQNGEVMVHWTDEDGIEYDERWTAPAFLDDFPGKYNYSIDVGCEQFTYYNGWIYFTHNYGSGPSGYYSESISDIYKIRPDGSGLEQVYHHENRDEYSIIERVSNGCLYINNEGWQDKVSID